MPSRRSFLKTGLFGIGAAASLDPRRLFPSGDRPPMRFVFMHRGNGLWPKVMVPPSFDEGLRKKEKRKEPAHVDAFPHRQSVS